MKRGDLVLLAVALVVATLFIVTGAARLPIASNVVLKHRPVFVYASPVMAAGAKRVVREGHALGDVIRRASAREALRMREAGIIPDPRRFARATPGEEVPISLTQYCLSGTTRRGRWVRPGIVAADPRIFPLARYVEIFMGNKYLGRFLVDDTGEPIIFASVMVERADDDGVMPRMTVVQSDDAGRYRVGGLAEGRVLVATLLAA